MRNKVQTPVCWKIVTDFPGGGGIFPKSAPFMLKQDLIFFDRRGLILFGSISMEMGINKKKKSLFSGRSWGESGKFAVCMTFATFCYGN